MAKPRKQGNRKTTISIGWEFKDRLRKHAKPTKISKTGANYESDEIVLEKILAHYEVDHAGGIITTTYPSRKVNINDRTVQKD